MTKKQHRRLKAKRLEDKQTYDNLTNERPIWANDEKFDEHERTWKEKFMTELKMAISLREAVA